MLVVLISQCVFRGVDFRVVLCSYIFKIDHACVYMGSGLTSPCSLIALILLVILLDEPIITPLLIES